MNDDKIEISGEELTQFLRDALEVEPIAEELRLHLNEVIARNDINPLKALAALTYLSAAYLRYTQEYLACSPAQCDELEGTFHNSIQLYLAIFGHNELKKEMERIRREELN